MIPYRSRASPAPRTPQTWASRWALAALGALALAAAAPVANALLIDRGPDNFGNHLIYDTELNVTWYQPHNSELNWADAHSYASNLSVVFDGKALNDWRLPRAADTRTGALNSSGGCYVGWGDDKPGNANCLGELGHLYLELGGKSNPSGAVGMWGGTNPRAYGNSNPFKTWPACANSACQGGGYYWLEEGVNYDLCGKAGWLIRWNTDYWGPTGATGEICQWQTDYKFAWALRNGDVLSTATPDVQSAVEYFHRDYGHYFVTSMQNEISSLDAGRFSGWARTGQSFRVYPLDFSGASNVCRFWSGRTFVPKSSHFYTPYDWDCAQVKRNPDWQFEGEVFALALPDQNGRCPTGTAPLYRLYNNGSSGAPNHRYTASRSIFDQMRGAGWTPESDWSNFTFACVPSAAMPTGPEGLWLGSTSYNQTIFGIVLPSGTFFFIYSTGYSLEIGGVFAGAYTFANGVASSTLAYDFNFAPDNGIYPATVRGTYVPGSTLRGTVTDYNSTSTFTAQFMLDWRGPPNLAEAVGTYIGTGASPSGVGPATATLTASGLGIGSSEGCTFSGTVTPRSDINAFDLSVQSSGALCALGNTTLNGIAIYTAADRTFYATGVNASLTTGFVFVGRKQ